MFRSTESERFDTDIKERTPIQYKNSVLGKKPFMGKNTRHQLIKSPERSYGYGVEMNSAGMHTETRHFNNTRVQKENEEEIGLLEDSYTHNPNVFNGF